MKRVLIICVQAGILALVASALGLAFNALRPSSFPLVAGQPYMIYKDCPMMPKEAKAVAVTDLPQDLSDLFLLDARSADEFARQRLPGSRNQPYRPLKSPPAALIEELRKAGPNRVLVLGDAEIDSGRLLAAELSGAGCLGVRYVKGGWPALVKAGRIAKEARP